MKVFDTPDPKRDDKMILWAIAKHRKGSRDEWEGYLRKISLSKNVVNTMSYLTTHENITF